MTIFRLHSQNTNKEYGFEIEGVNGFLSDSMPESVLCREIYDPDTKTWTINSDQSLEMLVEDLESMYGVHDCHGYGEPGKSYVDGYTSYEIEEAMYPVLVEKYREFFQRKGYTCGSTFVRKV